MKKCLRRANKRFLTSLVVPMQPQWQAAVWLTYAAGTLIMNCCNRTDWESSWDTERLRISFPEASGCYPRKCQPLQLNIPIGQDPWKHFNLLFVAKHSILSFTFGWNRKNPQAICSGEGIAPQEQELPQFCSQQLKISHSLTRLAVICSIFHPVLLHPFTSTETGIATLGQF